MPSKQKLVLDSFLPYRLSVLTNRMSAAIALHYSRRFGLSIPEWRVMAVLGEMPGLSARQVAERTAMDKVQVSRAVQSLLAAKHLTRNTDKDDGRMARLSLSERGMVIYREVAPLALQLEREFLSVLSEKERVAFDATLTKLGLSVNGLSKA
jgi:DNA-binding MarR family transcriptional regulator